MVTYLAMQILKGKISYTQTVEKFPQYKEDKGKRERKS